MSITIYAKCELCHQLDTLYEWGGVEWLCYVCTEKTAQAMSNPPDAPKTTPQDCAMCGGYDLRCPRCHGGQR